MNILAASASFDGIGIESIGRSGASELFETVPAYSYLTDLLRQAEEIIRGRSAPDFTLPT